jgi:hypothetical protein
MTPSEQTISRDMQRLYIHSYDDPWCREMQDWDHADEAARYLERQERLARGLRVVEEEG